MDDIATQKKSSLLLFSLLIVCSLAIWVYFQGSYSPFITQTNPMLGEPGKAVYGYSYFYNGDLYHKENFYPLEQLQVIKSGDPGKPGAKRRFTDRRFFYPAIANLFSQFVSSVYAFQLLNLVALLCSLSLLFHFTLQLGFGRPAAWAAIFFCLFSPATVMFVGDSSPHLVGNTFYYLWVVLLLGFYRGECPWRKVIGMGLFLCLWRTVYPSSGYGGALMFLLLLYRREWLKAIVPVLALLAFPRAQMKLLELFQIQYGRDTEHLYFARGLKTQFERLMSQPIEYFIETLRAFLNFLFIDNPFVLFIAVSALLLTRIRDRAFLWFILLLPVCIVLPVYPASSARAYIVSGSGIVFYALAGLAVIKLYTLGQESSKTVYALLRGKLLETTGKLWALLSILLVFVIFPAFTCIETLIWIMVAVILAFAAMFLGSQLLRKLALSLCLIYLMLNQIIWSTGGAPPIGLPMPYHSFVRGFFITEGMGSFMLEQPAPWIRVNYKRATGSPEHIPSSLGGTKSWADFVDISEEDRSIPVTPNARGVNNEALLDVLLIQSLFVALVIGCMITLLPFKPAVLSVLLFLSLFTSAIFFGDRTGFDKRFARYQDQVLTVKTGQRLEGELTPSSQFMEEVRTLIDSGAVSQIELYVNVTKRKRGRPIFRVWDKQFAVRAENTQRNNVVLTPDEFLEHLQQHHNTVSFSIEFEGEPDGQTYAGSWQNVQSDKDRSASLIRNDGSRIRLEAFPAFEIRLRDKAGHFHLIGL